MGSFSYTSRVSLSEESVLHSPCCFQWAVLGTLVFNHACMPNVSFSEKHQTIDVVEFHVGRQKSYSTLILDTEKESVSGKERQQQGLSGYSAAPLAHTAAHEMGFVSCYRYEYGKHGSIGSQRPLTQVTWQVWAGYWRASATD